ncbi:MAG: lytic transglycosylase domain-containing protein [Nocardioidaceae bacterium]
MRHTTVGLGLTTALAVSLAPLATGPNSFSGVDTVAHTAPHGHVAAHASAAPSQAAPSRTVHARLDESTDGGTPYPPPQRIAPRTVIEGRILPGDHRKVRVDSPHGGHVWTASALLDHDLPAAALKAYKNAAASEDRVDPSCQIPWTLLAGIGRVESNHGRFAGSVLGSDGISRPAIVGVPLNGAGPVAAIHDTDNGRYDRDTVWDRAVGPMQFIPSTWAYAGRDGDGDGIASPNDINDAALAAAGYLCSGAGSLRSEAGMRAAIFRYNPSDYYVSLVTAFAHGYQTGVFVIPSPPAPDQAAQQAKRDKLLAKAQHKRAKAKKAAAKKAAAKKAAAKKAARIKAAKVAGRTGARTSKAGPGPSTSAKPSGAAKAPAKTTKPSSSSKPTHSPSSSDSPSPATTPSNTDSPSASASPQTSQLTGTLAFDGTTWTVDQTVVDVAGSPDATTLVDQLTPLVGTTVTLEVEQGTERVLRVVAPTP